MKQSKRTKDTFVDTYLRNACAVSFKDFMHMVEQHFPRKKRSRKQWAIYNRVRDRIVPVKTIMQMEVVPAPYD